MYVFQPMKNVNKIKVNSIHFQSELQGEEGTCGLCAKTFSRKSSLLSHMRNHSVDRKFICSYCQKGFTQAANLRNHERIHRNER